MNYYCEKCGNEINKEDIKYTGREINNKYFCHRCGALLNVDSNFYDEDNYQCYVCGYVHNNYIDYGYDEDDDYDKYNFDDEEGYDEYEEDEDYNEYDNGVDYNKYYEDNNYNNHTTNNYTYNEFNINYKRHTGMDGIDCLDDIDDLDLDADSKDSNKHDIIKLIIITLNIWFLIGALIFLIIKLDDSKTMVKVPITQKGAEGIDYKKIEKKFKDAGFTNVIVKAQNDIVFGIFAKKNTVDYIEIDGSKKFEKNDRVEEDSEVVIYYHSK